MIIQYLSLNSLIINVNKMSVTQLYLSQFECFYMTLPWWTVLCTRISSNLFYNLVFSLASRMFGETSRKICPILIFFIGLLSTLGILSHFFNAYFSVDWPHLKLKKSVFYNIRFHSLLSYCGQVLKKRCNSIFKIEAAYSLLNSSIMIMFLWPKHPHI